jgi:hypothetical protein
MKLFCNTKPLQSAGSTAAGRLRSVVDRSKGNVPPSAVPEELIKKPKIPRRFWSPNEVEQDNE